jgi:hypothetical protein
MSVVPVDQNTTVAVLPGIASRRDSDFQMSVIVQIRNCGRRANVALL